MPRLEQHTIDDFLDRIKLTRTPGTYIQYHGTVDQFLRFCAGREPDTDLVEDWIRELIERGKAPNTVARHASVLKQIFAEQSIAIRVRTPVTLRKLPSWLESPEVPRFVRMAKKYAEMVPQHGYIYPAIVTLLACGLRSRELLGLKHSDLRVADRSLTVWRKRNKQAVVPMPDGSFQILLDWSKKQIKGKQRQPLIFPGVTYKALYRDVRIVAKMSQFSKRVTPHVLRHTCGTQLAKQGMHVDQIAEVLGDTIEVARIYMHVAAHLQKLLPEVPGLDIETAPDTAGEALEV